MSKSANERGGSLYGVARAVLFALPPEDAHELVLKGLENGIYAKDFGTPDRRLTQTIAGLAFENPVGIAAGFDKDARVPDAVLALGCGFAEIGTVTPLAQTGNPQPRLFRLVPERALINRLGFNNAGHDAARTRLERRAGRPGIVGVNVGANQMSADRIADYVRGIEAFYGLASYFMVNISSPNTTGLRKLQDPANLDELLSRVMSARKARVDRGEPSRPVFVKIAPDIADDDIGPVCQQLMVHAVDGIAVSNTTLSRAGVQGKLSREGGGLSGPPLFERSTIMLARVYRETGGRVPLIGIGGVDSGETALAKIEAGASLVQLYTGLVYEGPGLIGRIKRQLADAVATAGVASITELIGRRSEAWAAKPLP
ncbi:MAG: quinone-dependent dihydroorotate dehydrogenase [Hyphomicrobium aestuarii]|nr:quinone-dependent dihydroorotate dehydrogenase [Hyphomicrobium aestuarii]